MMEQNGRGAMSFECPSILNILISRVTKIKNLHTDLRTTLRVSNYFNQSKFKFKVGLKVGLKGLNLRMQNSVVLINFTLNMSNSRKHKKQERYDSEEETNERPSKKVEEGEKKLEKEAEQVAFEAIPPKKVSYCPICTLPFELCKYGRNPNDCAIFLHGIAPTKVQKYHPTFDLASIPDQPKEIKVEKLASKDSKTKTVKDKYVMIQVKSRGRKLFTTTISGLLNFGVDTKELAKKCSKKYATSCSVVEAGVIVLQGDNMENIKEVLIMECGIKKKYILSKEEFEEKHQEEVATKKKQKREENKGKDAVTVEPVVQPEVNLNAKRFEDFAASQQQDSSDED